MGSSGSCCGNGDAELAGEQKEYSGKQAAPGAASTAFQGAPEVSAPKATREQPTSSGTEYEICVDKSKGTRLGVDVDHQDGVSLLIEGISTGLIESWNNENAANSASVVVHVGDRIMEVNGHRGDVLQLVHECKQDKMLKMKLKRASGV
mmetsp:Transcript_50786/g.149706  ORF Transcript_50786/g.149706 Transcript_50786/m.149706 type:complete len:149 (+) Transcript_50786:71-517(+)